MRIVAAAVLAIAAVASTGGGAKAQDLPWCAIFSGDLGGVRSCAYHTQEQCRATVSGVGGFCQPNPWHTGPSTPSATRRTRWR